MGTLSSAANLYMKVDKFASEYGYYKLEDESQPRPDIRMQLNVEYTLVQTDKSNW